MNSAALRTALRDNWYLFLAAAILLAVGVYKIASPGPPKDTLPPRVQSLAGPNAEQGPPPETPGRPSDQDQARALIAEHQTKIDAEPDGADAPAYWNAMGNLYRQKLTDYAEAAQCYEKILFSFPDWDGVRQVYPQLATCYERAGDREKAEWTYKRMIEAFPEDQVEHQYAKDRLGM